MDVDRLIEQLRSAEVAQRRSAADALSRADASSAVMALVGACGDPDEQVQESAGAALEDLGPPPAALAGELAGELRREGAAGYWAATLLGRLGEGAAAQSNELGTTLLKNPDLSVRHRAAWALAQIGPPAAAAIPALEAAAAADDARLARLANDALQKIKR